MWLSSRRKQNEIMANRTQIPTISFSYDEVILQKTECLLPLEAEASSCNTQRRAGRKHSYGSEDRSSHLEEAESRGRSLHQNFWSQIQTIVCPAVNTMSITPWESSWKLTMQFLWTCNSKHKAKGSSNVCIWGQYAKEITSIFHHIYLPAICLPRLVTAAQEHPVCKDQNDQIYPIV